MLIDKLSKSYALKAEWMLKGRSAEFEKARILNFIEQQKLKRKRIKRDVLLTIIGVTLGLIGTIIYDLII